MHRLVAFLSTFVLAVPLSADTATANCAPAGLAPKVLNGATAAVVDGEGGIVVGAVAEVSHRTFEKGDVSVQRTWLFKRAPTKIETLAPGLSVYRTSGPLAPDPAEAALVDAQRDRNEAQRALAEAKLKFTDAHPTVQAAQGRLNEAQRRLRHAEAAIPPGVELADDNGKTLGWLKPGTKAVRTAAPKVKTITFASMMGRRNTTQVAVTLDGDAPSDAVAMVLADAKGTPRSWTAVDPAHTPKSVLFPFRTHSCLQVPNGTIPSATGDSVVVFWIDATGKKSEATRPLTIAAAKPVP